jgi:hypothetical protein
VIDREYGMPQGIRSPYAYVLARASIEDGGRWLAGLLRACATVVDDLNSVELVDEEQASEAGDLASATIKISKPLLPTLYNALFECLRTSCPVGVSVQLIPASSAVSVDVGSADFSVEHFRREFAVDSQFTCHGVSCTRITHRPSGSTARSTMHRSRLANDEEAIVLMSSILMAGHDAA